MPNATTLIVAAIGSIVPNLQVERKRRLRKRIQQCYRVSC